MKKIIKYSLTKYDQEIKSYDEEFKREQAEEQLSIKQAIVDFGYCELTLDELMYRAAKNELERNFYKEEAERSFESIKESFNKLWALANKAGVDKKTLNKLIPKKSLIWQAVTRSQSKGGHDKSKSNPKSLAIQEIIVKWKAAVANGEVKHGDKNEWIDNVLIQDYLSLDISGGHLEKILTF